MHHCSILCIHNVSDAQTAHLRTKAGTTFKAVTPEYVRRVPNGKEV